MPCIKIQTGGQRREEKKGLVEKHYRVIRSKKVFMDLLRRPILDFDGETISIPIKDLSPELLAKCYQYLAQD